MKIALEYRTIKAAKRNDHSNPITAAFYHISEGIKKSKHELTTVEEADVVFVFGSITERKTQTERYLVIDELRKSGKHILSIDSGLFGTYIRQATANPESNFFRVVYGDCTGEGDILFKNMSSDRLDWFQQSYKFKVKEPKGDTGDILFIGQSEKGWQYNNLEPFYEWAKKSLQEIRYNTNRKIIYRIHPTDSTNIKSLVNDVDNLHMTIGSRSRVGIIDDLKDTTTSVTHSSSAALESLVEGNHTIALDDRCIVAKACARSITDQMPWQDRQQHLQDFAYCTWHISEFANPKLIETYINLIKDKK